MNFVSWVVTVSGKGVLKFTTVADGAQYAMTALGTLMLKSLVGILDTLAIRHTEQLPAPNEVCIKLGILYYLNG